MSTKSDLSSSRAGLLSGEDAQLPAGDAWPAEASRSVARRLRSTVRPRLRSGGTSSLAPGRLFSRSFVAVLCVQPFFGFAYSSFLLLPKYLTLHGAGPELIGRVTATATFASAFAAVASGRFVERIGLRRMLVLGAMLEGLCGFAFLWTGGVGPLLFVLRAAQGVAYALALNAMTTLVANAVPAARLGQALGLLGVAGLTMNALAPIIAEPLARSAGWNPVFALAGGAAVCAALVALIGIGEEGAPHKAVPERSTVVVHPTEVYLASFLIGIGLGAMFNFTQPFALRLGMRDVGGLFLGYTGAALFVRTVFGRLPDQIGRRRVGSIAMVMYGITVAVTAALRPGWLVPLGAMLGCAHGMFYPAFGALAVQGVPRGGRALIMAIFTGSFNMGVAMGQLAFGPVAERLGFPPAFLLSGAMILLGVPWVARPRPATDGIEEVTS